MRGRGTRYSTTGYLGGRSSKYFTYDSVSLYILHNYIIIGQKEMLTETKNVGRGSKESAKFDFCVKIRVSPRWLGAM